MTGNKFKYRPFFQDAGRIFRSQCNVGRMITRNHKHVSEALRGRKTGSG